MCVLNSLMLCQIRFLNVFFTGYKYTGARTVSLVHHYIPHLHSIDTLVMLNCTFVDQVTERLVY